MKRLFSCSLYREALRQSKIVAIPAFVLMELVTALPIIGEFLAMQTAAFGIKQDEIPVISYPDSMLSFLLCFVIIPFLVLYLFSFLNKRYTSDFYHALPYTREAIYVSHTAAVLTYGIGIFLLSSLTSLLLYSTLMSPYVIVEAAGFWRLMFTGTATIVLITGAMLVAVSVTGTILTNLVVSGLILFLPRFVLVLFELLLSESPLLIDRFLPFPFGSYNLITSTFSSLFGRSFDIIWNTPVNGVYTLCLGLLYIGLGGWLFHRRKSEAAGQSAPSRKLQALFRLCIGLTISLPATLILLLARVGNSSFDATDIFFIFVIYLFAVLAYLFYELITTRKFRNLAKSLPALGILVLLNVAAYGIGIGIYEIILHRIPTPADVESVQFVFSYEDELSYFDRQSEQVRYTDPAVCTAVAEALAHDAQAVRDFTYDDQDYDMNAVYSVKINLKHGASLYRRVRLSKADADFVNDARTSNEEYTDIFWNIPSPENCHAYCNSSLADGTALYQSIYAERDNYPKEQWVYYLLEENNKYPSLAYITVSTYSENQAETFYIPITADYPETARLFIEQNSKQFPDIVKSLDVALEKQCDYFNLDLCWGETDYIYCVAENKDTFAPFQILRDYLASDAVKAVDDPTAYVSVLLQVNCWKESESGYTKDLVYENYELFLSADWLSANLKEYSESDFPELILAD